jgi:hypothetical protein
MLRNSGGHDAMREDGEALLRRAGRAAAASWNGTGRFIFLLPHQ